MAISLYAAGTLLGKSLLPTVFGVAIHPFAWMIVVVTILAMLGWVPQETKAAAKRLQSFMSSCLVLTIMVGVGADTDLNQLMAAITLSNVVISFLIVVGAILGSAIVGQWVGFYPVSYTHLDPHGKGKEYTDKDEIPRQVPQHDTFNHHFHEHGLRSGQLSRTIAPGRIQQIHDAANGNG